MVLNAVAILLAIATAFVFLRGVYSMARGGAYDRHHSGGLMLARVELQAAALAILALAAFLASL